MRLPWPLATNPLTNPHPFCYVLIVNDMTSLNADRLNRTIFISDNLPFLKALDTACVDLVCIDPPFGKNETFSGSLRPPLSDEERRVERELMHSRGVYDPDTAYEMGLEYPDQEGATANAGQVPTNIWTDIRALGSQAGERTGYPTQKPQALARRIIEASSDPGDLVLDCFAGCAYVPVAAELTGRRWIACDMSPRAWTIVRRQFSKQRDLRIVTEGEYAAGEGVAPALGDDRIIRVRGPNELPTRASPDDAPPHPPARPLPAPQYKRRPLESGKEIWDAFVETWGTGCWYCGTVKQPYRQELQLDHVEPNSRDGANDDCWNRALACVTCNGAKSDSSTPEQAIARAFQDGRIATPALRDETLAGFARRRQWARERYETLKAAREN